jgi:DNA-binding LacI/PurR family transcriptional regulator
MLKRGHRKIAVYAKPGSEAQLGFEDALADAGIAPDSSLIVEEGDIFASLQRILDAGEATALISNGGASHMEKVLLALESRPRGKELELLLDYTGPSLPGLLAKHPSLNVVGVNRYPSDEIGRIAGKALLDKLLRGAPLKSAKLLSTIEPGRGLL